MNNINSNNTSEYDGYVIPAYDPAISEEERKRLKEVADKKLKEAIERIKSKYQAS